MRMPLARLQPRRRVDRLPVVPQLDIERRPVAGAPGSQPGITPTGSPAATCWPDLGVQPVEAGQHGMVAAAAIDDQQQPVAAERAANTTRPPHGETTRAAGGA